MVQGTIQCDYGHLGPRTLFLIIILIVSFLGDSEETNNPPTLQTNKQTNKQALYFIYKNTREGERGTDTKQRICDAGTGAVIVSYAPTMHCKYL